MTPQRWSEADYKIFTGLFQSHSTFAVGIRTRFSQKCRFLDLTTDNNRILIRILIELFGDIFLLINISSAYFS